MKKIYWIIGIILFMCIGIEADAEDELPYMSNGYLERYVKENEIDTYSFGKASKVEKSMSNYSGGAVLVKLKTKLGKQPYYGQTDERDAEFLYMGKLKKNKPNGIGTLLIPVELTVESEEDGKAFISEYSGYSEEYYFARVYIGEFKDGRPEGYGIEFSAPCDESYIMQPIDLNNYGNDDIQEAIFESANPRKYEGEFKNGQHSGKGNEYFYMGTYWDGAEEEGMIDYSELFGENEEKNSKIEAYFTGKNEDIIIYSGKYKKGKRDGKFKIYEYGYLSYEGDMKKDEQTGKGKVYYPCSRQLQYEGELTTGRYDGKGTLYNEDGSIKYEGGWIMGEYDN